MFARMRQMHKSFRRAATALLLACLSFAGPASALPGKRDSWSRVETDHFVFFSGASDRTTRRIAANLERLRSILAELNPGTALGSDRPLYLYVFDSNSELTPYKPLYEGKPANVGGYFLQQTEASYLVIQTQIGQDVERLLYHEYLHFVLGNNYSRVPLWLNEGMAEFYSTFRSGETTADIGLTIPDHIQMLRQSPLIPLSQLFAVDSSSKDYNEGYRQGIFYAESWALVHYLLLGNPERRPQTFQFFQEVVRGRPVTESFRDAFQTTEAQLERELRDYLRRELFNYVQFPVKPESEVAIRLEPLPQEELLTRLGELLLMQVEPRVAEAEKHFQAALAARPGYVPAQVALCRAQAAADHRDAALACVEKAAAAAPTDAGLRLHQAHALRDMGAADAATEARIRDLLQQAVALEPENGTAWSELALTYVNENPMPPEGLRAMEAAWRLRPGDGRAAENLVVALIRSGQREAAARRITEDIAQRLPALTDRLWEAWETENGNELSRLLADQKLDEALTLGESLLLIAPPGALRSLSPQITELRRVVLHNRFAKRFNDAVALTYQQKAEEALAIVKELAATTADPKDAETARQYAAKLEEHLKGRRAPRP